MNTSPLINLGELSKPATVLIEKISEAIGGVFRPYQIKRLAEAEAEAEKLRAASQIDVIEIQMRGLIRFIQGVAKEQANIEDIAAKALPLLNANAKPESVEQDWIANFFDKSKLISDGEMQMLWAKVLAGEANHPGRYSKRTVALLASMDKRDAEMLAKLRNFCMDFRDNPVPAIFDIHDKIYASNGLTFPLVKHLAEIGLLTYESLGGFSQHYKAAQGSLMYINDRLWIRFKDGADTKLHVGHALLSESGKELIRMVRPSAVPGFCEYAIGKWNAAGITVSSMYPRMVYAWTET